MMREQRPVIWFEIPVRDLDRAANFYGEMFGWRFGRIDSDENNYYMIEAGDSINGGLRRHDDVMTGDGPLVYIAVEGLLESMERAKELGGSIDMEPTLISEQAGAYAILRDPDGNRVGIWVP
ncbi:MAG: VOC family protein [Actinomycetota bacterium]|nr:VOC family protein [Actinomycetota bacterium]